MPSLMAARGVGQNSVLFFTVCGRFQRYLRSSREVRVKLRQNLDVFGLPYFGGGEGATKISNQIL